MIRRDSLSGQHKAIQPADEPESTRIAEPGQISSAFAAAEERAPLLAEADPEATEAKVELDESFYDGIEIGADAHTTPPPAAAVEAKPARQVARTVARKVTTNVVRRSEKPTQPPPMGTPASGAARDLAAARSSRRADTVGREQGAARAGDPAAT